MLGMDFIRDNRAVVEQAIEDKGVDLNLDDLLAVDHQVRTLTRLLENDRAKKNEITEKIKKVAASRRLPQPESAMRMLTLGDLVNSDLDGWKEESKRLGAVISDREAELNERKTQLITLLFKVPNIPYSDAPVGPDET